MKGISSPRSGRTNLGGLPDCGRQKRVGRISSRVAVPRSGSFSKAWVFVVGRVSGFRSSAAKPSLRQSSSGCKPVFLDVDPETFLLSETAPARKGPVDALIAVHLFGNPVNIPRLRLPPGIPVVEDCAHTFFGEIQGRSVGTLGAGAMYSFGLGKPVSLGRLGAAVPRTSEAVVKLDGLHTSLPEESSRRRVSRAVMSRLVAVLYRQPWYGMFAFKVAQQYESSMDPMGKEVTSFGSVSSDLMGIVSEKVQKYRKTLPAQREAWASLADTVTDAKRGGIVPQLTPDGCVSDRWLFAVHCPSTQDRDRFVDALAREGVDSIKFYDRVPAIARERFGYRGGCPSAEDLCKSVVVIPVRVPTDRDGGEELVGAVLRAIRGAR